MRLGAIPSRALTGFSTWGHCTPTHRTAPCCPEGATTIPAKTVRADSQARLRPSRLHITLVRPTQCHSPCASGRALLGGSLLQHLEQLLLAAPQGSCGERAAGACEPSGLAATQCRGLCTQAVKNSHKQPHGPCTKVRMQRVYGTPCDRVTSSTGLPTLAASC